MHLPVKFFAKPKTQDEQDSEYARIIASKMSSVGLRKKAYADIMGILAILGYLKDQNFECKIHRSLHQIPTILEEFGITDIYYNNYRIDVITNYNTNITRIPKCQADYDIMADYYIIVKLAPNLKDFRILGYVKPDDVIMSYHDDKYYYPDKRLPIKDLFNIMMVERKSLPNLIGKHVDCESLFLRFLEKELSYSYKKTFIQHLTTCESCTRRYKDFSEFHLYMGYAPQFPFIIQSFYNNVTGSANPTLYKKINYTPKQVSNTKIVIRLPKFVYKIRDFMKNAFKLEEAGVYSIPARTKNEAIDLIFKDKIKFDIDNIALLFTNKKVTFLICAVVLVFTFGLIGIISAGSTPSEISFDESSIAANDEAYSVSETQEGDSYDFVPTAASENNGTISYNGLEYAPVDYTGNTITPDTSDMIKKVSWTVPESISQDPQYKRFLQIVGKNIKLNLQNDLLLARDIPKNRNIRLDIQFSGATSIMGLKIVKGSGSVSIDDIIQRGVFEAFTYIKPPKKTEGDINLTLLIDL